jgi:hypothetical protein
MKLAEKLLRGVARVGLQAIEEGAKSAALGFVDALLEPVEDISAEAHRRMVRARERLRERR